MCADAHTSANVNFLEAVILEAVILGAVILASLSDQKTTAEAGVLRESGLQESTEGPGYLVLVYLHCW